MLSFDITDRNIRVVKGVESNGKIKISSAATLNIEEGLIVNGVTLRTFPMLQHLSTAFSKRTKCPIRKR